MSTGRKSRKYVYEFSSFFFYRKLNPNIMTRVKPTVKTKHFLSDIFGNRIFTTCSDHFLGSQEPTVLLIFICQIIYLS